MEPRNCQSIYSPRLELDTAQQSHRHTNERVGDILCLLRVGGRGVLLWTAVSFKTTADLTIFKNCLTHEK